MKLLTSPRILLGLLAALLWGNVAAQALTPANTEITNQASATYNDSAGQLRTTTSNQVVTIVQQVYGVSLAPSGTTSAAPGQVKRALPGGLVYFNFTLTNTGNGQDSYALSTAQDVGDQFDYSAATAYADENCNGTRDAGEAASAAITLDAGGDACVLVEAELASGAGNGDTGNLSLTATSDGDGSAESSWARAVAEDLASFDLQLSRTPNGTVSPSGTLSYAFTGSNIGGAAAHGLDLDTYLGIDVAEGILVLSDIPDDTSYVGASLSGVAGAGTVVPLYYDGAAWSTTEPVPASTTTRVAVLITESNNGGFFPVTASFEMTFDVTVTGALAPQAISNSGLLSYSVGAATVSGISGDELTGTDVRQIESNTVANGQAHSYDFTLEPGVADAGTYMGRTFSVSGSTQTIAQAYSGDTVHFPLTLTNSNTSTTQDSFTLSSSNVPSGWTCGYRQFDGTTPLSGAVGPLAAGEVFDYSLVCTIPAVTAASTASISATATSAGDGGTATVTNEITTVSTGYGVSITHNAAGGTVTYSTTPATINSGESFAIPFEVSNAGQQADVFDLSATVIPAAWNVVIHHDRDQDDVADEEATTQTDLLDPGASADFVAVITVPASQAPVTAETITLEARSTSDSSKFDTITGTVDVTAEVGVTINPDRAGTVTTPGTITYTLNLQNRWSTAANVEVYVGSSVHGWTYQVSGDGGTSWATAPSSGSPVAVTVEPLDLAASNDGRAELLVRVIVPAGQPIGRGESVEVTAKTESVTATDSAVITTTVVGGDLVLEKKARTCDDSACVGEGAATTGNTQAAPGEYIEYTLTATNIGTAAIDTVIIMEPLPNFTDFESITANYEGDTSKVRFSTDGTTWLTLADLTNGDGNDWSAATFGTGDAIYVGLDVDGAGGPTSADELQPAEVITITFTVKVE